MESESKYTQDSQLKRESSDVVEEISCCDVKGREKSTIVASLNGVLLREVDAFPYYMLVAFEAGGIFRAILLLLAAPLSSFLSKFVSKAAGIQLLIFVSLAGLKLQSVQSVARAVLPKFFCEDVHTQTWTVFSSFGTRYLLTSTPRIMVQPFARDFLGVDEVFGTELEITKGGRITGFVKKPGVLVGRSKASVLREKTGTETPDCGVGNETSAYPFMCLCKEAFIVPKHKVVEEYPKEEQLYKTIVFHDGRFVRRPTPLVALLTILWIPFGFALAWLRLSACTFFPFPVALFLGRHLLGVQVKVNGIPRKPATDRNSGVLFVCNHRTLLDPVFLSLALGRRVPALTYSISRLTEILSPIKTVRMTRDRQRDAELIKKLLADGDLCICPEGTTCREPFLLRFSAMFAELTNEIVPVAVNTKQSMLHGTTANGWKGMDPFYFLMNPAPVYELTFLPRLPAHLTCGNGKGSHEVANYIQHEIARTLKFECTNFTRKDKYRVLAGTDGSVQSKGKQF
ncbi:unnamed protein product [Calypogeia fissa]